MFNADTERVQRKSFNDLLSKAQQEIEEANKLDDSSESEEDNVKPQSNEKMFEERDKSENL